MGNVIGHIVYDGTDSRDFGVLVGSTGTHVTPQRAVESVYVPGRNGALTIDKGRFDNVNITYQAMILNDFVDQFDGFKAFLFSHKGYARLEDSFDPDHFRLARINKSISPSVITFDAAGKFKIPFDCDPRRFLKSGEDSCEISIQAYIQNPTLFEAKPLFLIYGNGTISFNGAQITVTNNDNYIYVDTETLNAYDLNANRNNKVAITGSPVLVVGENVINASNTFMDLYMYPRWWTV